MLEPIVNNKKWIYTSEAQWEKSVKGLSEDSDVTLGPKENPIGYFGIKQVVRGYDEWTLDSFAPMKWLKKSRISKSYSRIIE